MLAFFLIDEDDNDDEDLKSVPLINFGIWGYRMCNLGKVTFLENPLLRSLYLSKARKVGHHSVLIKHLGVSFITDTH